MDIEIEESAHECETIPSILESEDSKTVDFTNENKKIEKITNRAVSGKTKEVKNFAFEQPINKAKRAQTANKMSVHNFFKPEIIEMKTPYDIDNEIK